MFFLGGVGVGGFGVSVGVLTSAESVSVAECGVIFHRAYLGPIFISPSLSFFTSLF